MYSYGPIKGLLPYDFQAYPKKCIQLLPWPSSSIWPKAINFMLDKDVLSMSVIQKPVVSYFLWEDEITVMHKGGEGISPRSCGDNGLVVGILADS